MAPVLLQPERWGKRERSDTVEKKGDLFLFLLTPLPPNSPLPPVCLCPLRLLRHGDQGTDWE